MITARWAVNAQLRCYFIEISVSDDLLSTYGRSAYFYDAWLNSFSKCVCLTLKGYIYC